LPLENRSPVREARKGKRNQPVSDVSRLVLKIKLFVMISPPPIPSFTVIAARGELKKMLPSTILALCLASTSGPK
jgi:hypothetical protein